MSSKKFLRILPLMAAAFCCMPNSLYAEPESQDPIYIAIADWTMSNTTAQIAALILRSEGYTVEIVPADTAIWYQGLESNDFQVALESWDTLDYDVRMQALETGNVVSLGPLGPDTKESWWYPAYMEEKCPGLPKWEALKSCAEAFSTPETAPMGRYFSAPVAWGGFEQERFEALDLPFVIVNPPDDATMRTVQEAAILNQEPLLTWRPSPAWMLAQYEGSWVELPPYEPACYTDPAWGINPNKTHDCDKPGGKIWKVASKAAMEKWPCAMKTLSNMTLSLELYEELEKKSEFENIPPEDVAKEWVENNESIWKKWVNCE